MQKMAMPDLQIWNLNLIENVEDTVFPTGKVYFSVSFSIATYKKNCAQVTFTENTQMRKKQFKETKPLIYISYLIRQQFQGYRCKSGIAIFAWSVS